MARIGPTASIEPFAVLDDSMVWKDNLWVYSHALILPTTIPEEDRRNVYVLSGPVGTIYSHEKKIYDFLKMHLEEDGVLYACNHYARYKSIWRDFVSDEVDKNILPDLPKLVRVTFLEAHNWAKKKAKERLEKLLEVKSA